MAILGESGDLRKLEKKARAVEAYMSCRQMTLLRHVLPP
jgi:hypothetical protein